eukprot:2246061-Rhodomonas_salina.1
MQELFDTVDQRDALRAGDDSSHGLVVTMMETIEEAKLLCRCMKAYKTKMPVLGLERGFTTAEINEAGEIKVSTVLTHELQLLFDICKLELDYYVEMTITDCLNWDKLDGTNLSGMFQKVLSIVVPKHSEYWSMGWYPTDASAAADHDTTLVGLYALQWLVCHSPGREQGLAPMQLWRKLHDDTLGGLTELNILTEARTKALKRNAGAASGLASSSLLAGLATSTASNCPSAGPVTPGPAAGQDAPDWHVHGPHPGQEPSREAVALVESKAMDTCSCLNCAQAGH